MNFFWLIEEIGLATCQKLPSSNEERQTGVVFN